MTREETIIFAALKPCVAGPLTDAARQIIVAGEHREFASCRALVGQILNRKPGPKPQLDDKARALNRKRELSKLPQFRNGKRVNIDAITLKLAEEFPMLDNFAEVMSHKPSGTLIARARELKFDESLVGLEAESDDA